MNFNLNEIIDGLLRSVSQHVNLPVDTTYAPLLAAAIVIVGGLLLMVRGARWGPAYAALTFLVVGAAAGWTGWRQFAGADSSAGIAAAVGGIVAAGIGVVFFRFWQALLLSACLVMAGLTVYGVRDLQPALHSWTNPGLQAEDGGMLPSTILPAAGSVVDETGRSAQSVGTRLSELWAHLSASVPSFATTFWGIVLATGVLGLLIGFFLPRLSRSLWAASVGTFMLVLGIGAAASQAAPGLLAVAKDYGGIAWAIVGALWLTSVLYNFRTLPAKKAAKADAGGDQLAAAAA